MEIPTLPMLAAREVSRAIISACYSAAPLLIYRRNRARMAAVQCKPGIRYDEEPCIREEALIRLKLGEASRSRCFVPKATRSFICWLCQQWLVLGSRSEPSNGGYVGGCAHAVDVIRMSGLPFWRSKADSRECPKGGHSFDTALG